jgi:hypothetical protein
MLDDLRQALLRLDRQAAKPAKAFSSEVDSGSPGKRVQKIPARAGTRIE